MMTENAAITVADCTAADNLNTPETLAHQAHPKRWLCLVRNPTMLFGLLSVLTCLIRVLLGEWLALYPYTEQHFNTLLVAAAIYFGYRILISSGLGFLGLGVQPPSPDWGLQVNDGRNFLLTAPWVVIYPALAISSLVIGVNLCADGLTSGKEC
jgi:ABC-type antimicrobial peptide transport system permease subunit